MKCVYNSSKKQEKEHKKRAGGSILMCACRVITGLQLTVFILVHQFKYSVTNVFNIHCDARVVVLLYPVDDLSRNRKEKSAYSLSI